MALTLIAYSNVAEPMRHAVRHHLESFGRYSAHECCYFNVSRPDTPRWLRSLRVDAVVLHTTFLGLRWTPAHLERSVDRLQSLDLRPRAVLAFPQDEFLRTAILCEALKALGATDVFSVAPPTEWTKIYPTLDRSRVRFRQVLTGYLDDSLLQAVERLVPEVPKRTTDLGYRAWRAAASLGRVGREKVEIAERFRSLPEGIATMDISTLDEEVLLGDDWIRFLLRCRAVLGTESGASVLDATGRIMEDTEKFVRDHPDADYEQIEAACFPGLDGSLDLRVIAPRHLEACATRTCQVLMRGSYGGMLEPEVHYVPLDHDYGNLAETVAAVQDDRQREAIVERAYRDIVASGRFGYERFVTETLDEVLGHEPHVVGHAAAAGLAARAARDEQRHRARLARRCRMATGVSSMLKRVGVHVHPVTLAQVPVVLSRVVRGQQRVSWGSFRARLRTDRANK